MSFRNDSCVRLYDGIYRLVRGNRFQDEADIYQGFDKRCALCRDKHDHSYFAHWALLVNEVDESRIDHFCHTVL